MPADRAATITGNGMTSGAASTGALPDVTHLERCVRHIVYRDVVRGAGGDSVGSAAARRLLAPDATGAIQFGEEGVGLDSLALISAATAVSRFFDLGASGVDDYLLFEDTPDGWARLVAQHLASCGDAAEIVFETSGSTDAPTLVRKRLALLEEEIGALTDAVLPSPPRRIVAMPPPQHIFGWLWTVLLPSKLGVPVVDAVIRGPGSVLRELSEGDLVVGTPFNWEILLNAGGGFPDGVTGVTSGGPMPAPVWGSLSDAGLLRLLEIFGSTETGGLGWRESSEAPFALLPHLERDGEAVRSRPTGDRFVMQDHMSWPDDTHFVPEGRIDRAVQIAGVNVSLSKVRDALCASDHVADAAVRPASERLKAFIVPSDRHADPDELSRALVDEMRQALEPAARPTSYTFGPDLPRNAMGKLTDWRP